MLNLVIDNGQITQAHQSALPALHALTALITHQILSGRRKEAIKIVKRQKFRPLALSFVAGCLVHNGIPKKTIEAVLLADIGRCPR